MFIKTLMFMNTYTHTHTDSEEVMDESATGSEYASQEDTEHSDYDQDVESGMSL